MASHPTLVPREVSPLALPQVILNVHAKIALDNHETRRGETRTG
jgi:hypothetical protein